MFEQTSAKLMVVGLASVIASSSSGQTAGWPDRVAEDVTPALTAGLAQGPILGRPAATSIRVWVRTAAPMDFQIRYAPQLPLDADCPSVRGRTSTVADNTGS